MFKLFKSSLGTELLPRHCVAPPEELVHGGMLINCPLPSEYMMKIFPQVDTMGEYIQVSLC